MDQNQRAAAHRDRDRQRAEIAARARDLRPAIRQVPADLDKPVRREDASK
jgi:hypothetical protein